MEDASDEPLIREAVIEGYLVHTVYIDQEVSVEVMFEHCFENLSLTMKSRLRSTHMDLVGFAGSVVKSLEKTKLEVVFDNGALFRRVMINFTLVWDPSHYNVILKRTGCKNQLKALLKKSMDVLAWELANMIGQNEREHGQIPIDQKHRKGVPRNEEDYSRAILADHPYKATNSICVFGSGSGGHECGTTNINEGETVPNTLHTKQSSSIRENGEVLGGIGKCTITYDPRNDIKCQTLFTEEESNSKGSGANLVLIISSDTKFTYALLLKFTSINNEADYEALVAREVRYLMLCGYLDRRGEPSGIKEGNIVLFRPTSYPILEDPEEEPIKEKPPEKPKGEG
nr:reverse transcriptase domain-containing protein [Tanacetum cinerariifolium]